MKSCLLALILVSTSVIAVAQRGPNSPANGARVNNSTRVRGSSETRDPSQQEPNIPEDMRIRLAIERAESEHRKVMQDVEKLHNLSEDVVKRYREAGKFSDDEIKKIGTIEKLAKRILNHAGGNEVNDKEGDAPRLSVAEAVDQMSVAVSNIKKSMTEETRFVVSAMVVANSNEVINLAQFIKRSNRQPN